MLGFPELSVGIKLHQIHFAVATSRSRQTPYYFTTKFERGGKYSPVLRCPQYIEHPFEVRSFWPGAAQSRLILWDGFFWSSWPVRWFLSISGIEFCCFCSGSPTDNPIHCLHVCIGTHWKRWVDERHIERQAFFLIKTQKLG